MKASDPNAAQTKRVPAESPKQTPTRENLAVEDLLTDTGTQIRSEISEYIVAEYVEALGDGARFPPVVIFRSNDGDILADGFHRVRAYQDAQRDEIEADVYQGDQKNALWFALGANRAHGQRLSADDKRKAIEIAYKAWPDISQRRIAAQVGCNQGYVGKVRARLNATVQLPEQVVGRDGRKRAATRPTKSQKASTTRKRLRRPPKRNDPRHRSKRETAPMRKTTRRPQANPADRTRKSRSKQKPSQEATIQRKPNRHADDEKRQKPG